MVLHLVVASRQLTLPGSYGSGHCSEAANVTIVLSWVVMGISAVHCDHVHTQQTNKDDSLLLTYFTQDYLRTAVPPLMPRTSPDRGESYSWVGKYHSQEYLYNNSLAPNLFARSYECWQQRALGIDVLASLLISVFNSSLLFCSFLLFLAFLI